MTAALWYIAGLVQTATLAWLLVERHERREQLRSLQAHTAELQHHTKLLGVAEERLSSYHRDINQLFTDTGIQRKKQP